MFVTHQQLATIHSLITSLNKLKAKCMSGWWYAGSHDTKPALVLTLDLLYPQMTSRPFSAKYIVRPCNDEVLSQSYHLKILIFNKDKVIRSVYDNAP